MKTKKLLSMLLALCLLLTLLPAAVGAEEVSSEPEVTGIQVEPITIIEGSSGYTDSAYNPETGKYEEYYGYGWTQFMEGVVTFADGTSVTFDRDGFEYNGGYYLFECTDDQYANHWTVGNTYTVEVGFRGKASVEVPVTIVESPVASLTIEPISMIEGSSGYMDTDKDGNEYFRYHWYNQLVGMVTFTDGTSVEFDSPWFEYQGEEYYLEWNDWEQYENHWTVGNTYTVMLRLMGTSVEVPVTIVESPVASITVEPISIIEGSSGYTETDRDGNEYFYYSWYSQLTGTVTFTNGTSVEFDSPWFEYQGVEYSLTWYDSQYETHWIVGNTYTETVSLMGTSVEVPVTIVESPVASITVEPISMIEGSSGYRETDYDGNEFFYYDWFNHLNGTVTFTDGTSVEFDSPWFEYQGEEFYLDNRDDQYEDHWSAGNTYNVTLSLMGTATEVPVTIVESPVASITIEPVNVIEGKNGYTTTDYNGNEFFCYSWYYTLNGTVTFTDGTSVEFDSPWFEYQGQAYNLTWNDNQYETHWTAGNTYTVTVNLMGATTDVQISVEEALRVTKIEVDPVTVMEKFYGSWLEDADGQEYFEHDWWSDVTGTVTFSNGDSVDFTGRYFEYNDIHYWLEVADDQYENHWVGGNVYTGTASLEGVSADVEITLEKYPIVSFEVDPITITEGTGGVWTRSYYDGHEYYYYCWIEAMSGTVNFIDGSSLEFMGDHIEYDGKEYYFWYDDDGQYEDHWTGGNAYSVEVFIDGCTEDMGVKLDVTIEHNFADATCTAPKTCKVCGATEGTALGHSFTNYVSNNDVTCTKDGTKTAKCDRCDATDTAADPAKGHDYAAATCTAPKTCKVCNATEGAALGHSFTNYVSNNDATCTKDGTKTVKCDRCEATDTVADAGSAKGHDYAAATCTAPKTCKVCGETEGTTIAHADANADNKCDMCGTVLKEEQPTDPAPTDPAPTDPVPTEPKPTEPEATEPKPTEPEPTVPEAEGPQTGDTMDFLPWIALLMLSAAGIVLCLILLERKRRAVR